MGDDRFSADRLSAADVRAAITACPELVDAWAWAAGTSAGSLANGGRVAVASLRAALARHGDAVREPLAKLALPRVQETCEVPADAAEPTSDIEALASQAGRLLGPVAARIFLDAVAASGTPLAGRVGEHLPYLRQVTERDVAPPSSGTHAAVPAPDQVPGLTRLAQRTDDLLAAGAELAGALQSTANRVAAGVPDGPAAERLRDWSAAVDGHLAAAAEACGAAPDLAVLTDRLDDVFTRLQDQARSAAQADVRATEEDRARQRRRQRALDGAALLHQQGLDEFIPGMLKEAGVDPAEWEQRLSPAPAPVPAAPVPAVVSGPPRAPSSPPAPAPAPASAPAELVPQQTPPEPAVPQAVQAVQAVQSGAEPPTVTGLIRAGRDALAVCLSEALPERPAKRRLVRLFCAAFSGSAEALDRQLPVLSPSEEEIAGLAPDECRLLLASALRAGLGTGWPPVSLDPLIERACGARDPYRALAGAAAEVIQRGPRNAPGDIVLGGAVLGPEESARRWLGYAERAGAVRESLARGGAPYPRAADILRHMIQERHPVGRALALTAELSAAGGPAATARTAARKWGHVDRVALDLENPVSRNQLIAAADQAVSPDGQVRPPLTGGPKDTVEAALREVSGLLAGVQAVRTALRVASVADAGSDARIARGLEPLDGEVPDRSEGDAALARLAQWLRSGAPRPPSGASVSGGPVSGVSVDDLVRAELEPLRELPRAADGTPGRAATPGEVAELLRSRGLAPHAGGAGQ